MLFSRKLNISFSGALDLTNSILFELFLYSLLFLIESIAFSLPNKNTEELNDFINLTVA